MRSSHRLVAGPYWTKLKAGSAWPAVLCLLVYRYPVFLLWGSLRHFGNCKGLACSLLLSIIQRRSVLVAIIHQVCASFSLSFVTWTFLLRFPFSVIHEHTSHIHWHRPLTSACCRHTTQHLPDMLLTRATQGVTGALAYDPLQYCILAAGTAVAWVYTVELNLVIFYTFKRRRGLYFWSLLISSWGCSLHALGFILKFLVGTTWLVDLPFIEVGWVSMVTGQAFVLYSRLHLVLRKPRTLNYVLALIIVDAIVLHLPTIIFTYGSNSPNAQFWVHKFNVMERIQLAGFCIQEFIISTIYIVSTVRLLGAIYHSRTRKVMFQLILINGICIGMDIILIGLEYTNNYVGEASIKPMLYAIKLKLEFAVLNQLMGLTKAGLTEGNRWRSGNDPNSHELKDRTIGSHHDAEAGAPQRKAGTWTTAKGIRGSLSGAAVAPPEQIYKTQHVDVVSEPISDQTNASSSTAVTAGEPATSSTMPKVKSLMGTATVFMPGRVARNSRPGETDNRERATSPSESQKEIIRNSADSEKEGTRWIEGHYVG